MSGLYRLFLLGVLLCVSGCATIVHGTTQKIPVSSDPTGANLTVVGQSTNLTTPCQVELSRKSDHILKFQKDGYDSATVNIRHVLSGAVAGNILAGGLIGWGVDATDGAQYRLVPETVNVTLKPKQQPQVSSPNAKSAISSPNKPGQLEKELDKLDQMLKDKVITKKEYEELRQKTIEKY